MPTLPSILLGSTLWSTALAGTPPASESVHVAQKAAWSGLGMSVAGSAMVLGGSYGFYDGPFDAVARNQDEADPQKATTPATAIGSGVVVGGGLGISAVGRPILSFGSTIAARQYQADGGNITPTLGWISVGAWAAGVGSYFAAQATDSTAMDWTWLAMRGASFGTGLAQLLQTRSVLPPRIHTADTPPTERRTPPVRLVVGPNGGAVVGAF
jgi:hypothetical protein